jgi:phosphoglycolate phosphatase
MQIFFDLDGTLIDSRPRLYRLFQYLVRESSLSFEEYWRLKRNRQSHSAILSGVFNYGEGSIVDFEKRWMAEIEKDEWLEIDRPFEGVTEFLRRTGQSHSMFIVTARQFTGKVYRQIESFGWTHLFKEMLVTNQRHEKNQLMIPFLPESTDWMIGDTGKDIVVGKSLGMKTAAVLSGFLNRESLEKYDPDLIVESVLHLDLA